MKEEIWKDINNYEGLYQVSSFGRVKSLPRTLSDGRKWKEHILQQETNHGYKRVTLANNNFNKTYRVHVLVAEAFLPDKFNFKHMLDENTSIINLEDLVINHKDENKSNNHVDNLEWCTPKYNSNYGDCKYKIAKQLSKPVIQYDINFKVITIYDSLSEAGRQTGYNIGYISQCCNGKYSTAYGYIWRYTDE